MSAEVLLQKAADEGTWETDEWPQILDEVLRRLDNIVENEFPRPTIPRRASTLSGSPKPAVARLDSGGTLSQDESQAADKENAPPPPSNAVVQSAMDIRVVDEDVSTDAGLSPAIIELHQFIRENLSKNFRDQPPHTVQRMAELLLHPRQHYRYLPPYLRALDRVTNVQSNVRAYPLPVQPTPYVAGLPNGTGSGTLSSSAAAAQLGSDESLGGALLTPIPWLRDSQEGQNGETQMELQSESTEIVEGPHGAGRVETVSVVNGVVTTTSVPVSSLQEALDASNNDEMTDEDLESRALSNDSGVEEEEEIPHARGPEVLGLEDLGPQSDEASAALGLNAKGFTTLDTPVVEEELIVQDPIPDMDEDLNDHEAVLAGGSSEEERIASKSGDAEMVDIAAEKQDDTKNS